MNILVKIIGLFFFIFIQVSFAEDFHFTLPSGLVIIFTTPDGISLEDALENSDISVNVTLQFDSQQQHDLYLSQDDGGISLGLQEFFHTSSHSGTITSTASLSGCASGSINHVDPIRVGCFFDGCTIQFNPSYRTKHCETHHRMIYQTYREKIESNEGLACPICRAVFQNFRRFFIHFGKDHKNDKLPTKL